ncbi:recombinase family protein [Sphingorhabdus sp. SMR4y]|uniref:recombinase family protein n=1 Tax=Sphingorhabdus sp. SMR4y TaxID=2584094 RepID=UPI000B5C94A7|nr:recombinase family protein [Sphingorhabdus sp. SMR4y]ASK88366.1 DNA-invertase hin [Sphingorhabdus sp. SMR4y]
MQKFVSYLRVSTNRQGQSGLGLEAQRGAVRNYLACIPHEHIDELVEVESGSKSSRPVLAEALAQCRREKATLVIAKLDRLARNVAFISSMMETGVDFVAVDAPYANKLMLHILSAFAEHEREQISMRTKVALAAAKARGVELGNNGKVLARQNRLAAKNFAETMRTDIECCLDQSITTYTGVAERLNEQEISSRAGTAWSATMVSRVMKRLDIKFS